MALSILRSKYRRLRNAAAESQVLAVYAKATHNPPEGSPRSVVLVEELFRDNAMADAIHDRQEMLRFKEALEALGETVEEQS